MKFKLDAGLLLVAVSVLIGCGDNPDGGSVSNSTAETNVPKVKEKEIPKLEICMEAEFSTADSFESLNSSEQESIRQCVQRELRLAGRLKSPKEFVPEVKAESDVTEEEKWILRNSVGICKAGVSFKNRWGDPGQAREGKYLKYENGEHIFQEHSGTATVRCLIAGTRLLMGWHSRPFDIYKFGDLHYTFEKHGLGVRITEHTYGKQVHRDFEFQ